MYASADFFYIYNFFNYYYNCKHKVRERCEKMKISIQKKSFRNRLILAFLLTSVLPVLFMILFSYYNSTKVVESSVDEMTQANL